MRVVGRFSARPRSFGRGRACILIRESHIPELLFPATCSQIADGWHGRFKPLSTAMSRVSGRRSLD
jgi:hypothetical protein